MRREDMEKKGEEEERQVDGGGRTMVGDAVVPYGCCRSAYMVHLGRGPRGWSEGSGSADLSGLPASLSAHCLPAALWLDLLTSACWILAPACGWLAAPSLPAAPPRWLHPGSEVGGSSLCPHGVAGAWRAEGRAGPPGRAQQHRRLWGKVRPAGGVVGKQRPGLQGLASWRREEGAGLARSAKAFIAAGLWIL